MYPAIPSPERAGRSKIHVTYKELPPPSSSTEVHQALVQQLARRNGDPDVFTLDIIWIAEFAAAKWALPLDQYFKDSTSEYFNGLVQACTWQDKLVALPWYVDSGMLYYRKDLGISAPNTWTDLIASAKEATGSGKVKFGFLWQAKQAEVLVCDLVSFIGSNGGSILQADGKTVSIADAPAVEAVQLMYDLINKEQVTPADVLSWDEEPSRRPFTGGEAAFLRNWSYVWKIAQNPGESKVVDQVAVVPLPHFPDKKSAASLGGYQFGINASGKKREAAVEFVRWMSSPETQLRFATQLGLCPTRAAVFERPEIGTEQPFMQQLKDVFLGAIPRPVTPKYPQVTLALQSAVSTALTTGKVEESLKTAKQKIETIIGLGMALVLTERFLGRGIVRAAMLIPWAIPTVVTSKMFGWLFDGQHGLVNYLARFFGLIHTNINWYGSPEFALPTIVMADVWKTTPFMALLLLAGLQTIPRSLTEAASIDGANPWQQFWMVRFPLLAPSLLIAAMFRALDAFRIFDLVYVLTGGGPADSTEVLSTLTYKNLFSALQFGYGSALSTVMFLTEIVIAVGFGVFLLKRFREVKL